jgi:hypothetical protein
MKTLRLACLALLHLSLGILGLGISGMALADNSKELNAHETSCLALYTDRTAAFVAGDWPSVESLAEKYLKNCKNMFGVDGLRNAYASIGEANMNFGRPKKTIAFADMCITASYASSGCHLLKARGLLALNLLPEAKVVLDRTDKLIKHALEVEKMNLRVVRYAIDKELAESKIREFEGQLSHSEALREKYFPG